MVTSDEVLKAVHNLDEKMQTGFKDHRTADDKSHKEILGEIKKVNGTVREHSITIAALNTTQKSVCRRLKKGEEERGTLFKLVRGIISSRAKQAGYIAGVMFVVVFVLQFLVMPALQHLTKGGP